MSLKLKRREFCYQNFVATLRELLRQKLDFKPAIEVGRIARAVQLEVEIFNQARDTVVRKFGEPYALVECPECKLEIQGEPGQSARCKCGKEIAIGKEPVGFWITDPAKRRAFLAEESAILEEEVVLNVPGKLKAPLFDGVKISGEEAMILAPIIEVEE